MSDIGRITDIRPLRLRTNYSTFLITSETGDKYVARLFAQSRFSGVSKQLAVMRRLFDEGFMVPEPIAIGRNKTLGHFMLESFVEGETLFDALGSASPEEQYALGVRVVKAIDQLKAFDPGDLPLMKLSKRIDDCLRFFADSGYTVFGLEKQLLREIEKRLGTFFSAPPVLLHGDCNVHNLILKPDGRICFLDWEMVRMGNWSWDYASALLGWWPHFKRGILGSIPEQQARDVALSIAIFCINTYMRHIESLETAYKGIFIHKANWEFWYECLIDPEKLLCCEGVIFPYYFD